VVCALGLLSAVIRVLLIYVFNVKLFLEKQWRDINE